MQAATISRRSNGAPRPCAMIGPPRTSTNSSSGTRGAGFREHGESRARARPCRVIPLAGLAGVYARA